MKKALFVVSLPVLAFIFVLLSAAYSFFSWFPSTEEIRGCMKTTMYAVDLCPGSKTYTPLNRISKFVQQTVVLTEDSGFYQHRGFDQEGIEHCFEKMKEKKKIVCGGSTLTQQLAKNLFLHKDKNFLRKGLEALITIKIENSLSKKEILERYLNVVQFGKNIFGIKQAAEFYFKKSPSELNVLESSFLAMILPNPEKYSQSYYRKDLTKFARRRLSDIIEKLYKYNRINQSDYLYAESNLDFFLKSGTDRNAQNRPTEDLSSEDLSEMLDQVSEPHDDRPVSKPNATPDLKNVEHQDDSEAIQNEKPEVELQN